MIKPKELYIMCDFNDEGDTNIGVHMKEVDLLWALHCLDIARNHIVEECNKAAGGRIVKPGVNVNKMKQGFGPQ